jgi:hypothetical protein
MRPRKGGAAAPCRRPPCRGFGSSSSSRRSRSPRRPPPARPGCRPPPPTCVPNAFPDRAIPKRTNRRVPEVVWAAARQGGARPPGPAARFPTRCSRGGGPVANQRADGRGVGLPWHHVGSGWRVARDALLRQLDCLASGGQHQSEPAGRPVGAASRARGGARGGRRGGAHRGLCLRNVRVARAARGWHDLECTRHRAPLLCIFLRNAAPERPRLQCVGGRFRRRFWHAHGLGSFTTGRGGA